MKRNKMCPFCYIRQLLFGAKRVCDLPKKSYENGVEKTPLMGWSSWNAFRGNIDEDMIYETAVAMKEKGLADAGYKYVNLDDCWQSNMRDKDGKLQGDLTRFSSGIPSLVEKINALGLKVGIYSSNGTLTCEDLPASLGREQLDADTFASWGIEYLKYDFCHNEKLSKYAPLIYGITIAKKGEKNGKFLDCKNGVVSGLAKFMTDKRLDGGKYVSGVDGGKGALEFDSITVDEDGEYVLTINVKKYGRYEKYLVAEVNGVPYEISFPPQKHFNVTARFQVLVNMKAGKNVVKLYNPIASARDSANALYRRMGNALIDASNKLSAQNGTQNKPILFSICEWGFNKPYLWGSSVGNMWRTTPDIRPIWTWIKLIYEHNVKLYKYSSAGHFNDPDMLEVGNGKLSYDENLSHFALWCFMNAPLVLGNDLRTMSDNVCEILINKDLISINQDELAKQCKRIKKGVVDVLAKPLKNGETAVCIFNKGANRNYSFDLTALTKDEYVSAKSRNGAIVKNVIGRATVTSDKLSCALPKHGVCVVIIK